MSFLMLTTLWLSFKLMETTGGDDMRKNRLMEFPAATQQGREAYLSGVRSRDDAQKSNPFKGFGDDVAEHSKFVCWNRGWNSMRKWSEAQMTDRSFLMADEWADKR